MALFLLGWVFLLESFSLIPQGNAGGEPIEGRKCFVLDRGGRCQEGLEIEVGEVKRRVLLCRQANLKGHVGELAYFSDPECKIPKGALVPGS